MADGTCNQLVALNFVKLDYNLFCEPLLFMLPKYTYDSDILYFTTSIKAEMLYQIYVVLDEKLVYTILFRMHLEKYAKTFVI